jgi:hypothetical protein
MSDLTLKSSDMSKQKVVIEHVEAKWTKRGKQLCMQKQAQIMQIKSMIKQETIQAWGSMAIYMNCKSIFPQHTNPKYNF